MSMPGVERTRSRELGRESTDTSTVAGDASQIQPGSKNYAERKDRHMASMSFTKPLSDLAVPLFLASYGFEAVDEAKWGEALEPLGAQLQVRLSEHLEVDGHTWYLSECKLERQPIASLEWKTPRRLAHFRHCLHHPIKSSLGEEYASLFKDACFAHRGGIPGTTRRLNIWCERLATHINERRVSPTIAAYALHFFAPPVSWSPDGVARCASERTDGSVVFSTFLPPQVKSDGSAPAIFGVPASRCFCQSDNSWHFYLNRSTGTGTSDRELAWEMATKQVSKGVVSLDDYNSSRDDNI